MITSILQSLIDGPLLVGDLPEARAFGHHHLDLPSRPDPLKLEQKLGHLYEDALAQLLKHSRQFQLLERNLQIQKDRHTTVGELDFLVRDLGNGSLIHLELATKFYLVVKDGSEITLPGPDARDNYHRKLARLRTHQLRLPQSHRQFLPKKYQGEAIKTEHLIYGCLFDHFTGSEPFQPEWISPRARRGKWLTLDELPPHPESPLRVIPKPLWPVPPARLAGIALENFSPGDTLDRCLMVLSPCGTESWFVTPSDYPTRHP